MPAAEPNPSRPIRFEERRSVVAVYAVPQRDEPPGRGNWQEVTVTLAERVDFVPEADVAEAVRKIHGVWK